MKDITLQAHFSNKRKELTVKCHYGLKHFCDGRPNRSVDALARPKPPCPKYEKCEIRKKSIYDDWGWDNV